MKNGFSFLWIGVFLLGSAACSAIAPEPQRSKAEQAVLAATSVPTFQSAAPVKQVTETAIPPTTVEVLAPDTATPIPHSPTPALVICPPLPGYASASLKEMIANPFNPPTRPGSDDPHQGIDLAYEEYGIAVAGYPVNLMLSGTVAAVMRERFPYGNALLVETPLKALPVEWMRAMDFPTPAPTLGPHPSLTCPERETPPEWDREERSLYLLYAHLDNLSEISVGDSLPCGQEIGTIGQSGNALNPHLHIEARIGPGGTRFSSIAHYESRVTPEEMWGYCTWRVSDLFQLVDPILLLDLLP